MNFSFFVAKRLYLSRQPGHRVSALATRIATIGVALGLGVMILSVCVLLGFKNELTEKITGFGSHIKVLNSKTGSSPESFPIVTDSLFISSIQQAEGVSHVQRFSEKMGIIKTDEDFKGIMLKGMAEEYDYSFLKQHIIEGELPKYGKEENKNSILISKQMADEMKLKVGERIFAYFFEKSIRARRFTIVGIYETNLSQFDENIIFANFYTVAQLNNFDEDQSSGLEIYAEDFRKCDEVYENVLNITKSTIDHNGSTYSTFTIKELYAIDGLTRVDRHGWVILGLMIAVAGFTMISGLLILILERTSTIGTLKALGSTNGSIRNIFLHYASMILLQGIVWGNVLGLGLAYIQQRWQIVTLDASKYYVSHVPIHFDFPLIVALNVGTLVICVMALIGPSYLVSKISPVKAIRFD